MVSLCGNGLTLIYSLCFGQADFNFGQAENQVKFVRGQVRKIHISIPLVYLLIKHQ